MALPKHVNGGMVGGGVITLMAVDSIWEFALVGIGLASVVAATVIETRKKKT